MTVHVRTTQAVILARGLGSRMRRETPDGEAAELSAEQRAAAATGSKGMMPLGSRPFLDYVISALADAGITEVVLVIGPEHHAVREYYSSAAPRRVEVKFAVQAEPNGTADAVQSARDVVRNAPFLVLNSDNYYPLGAYTALAELGASGLVAFEADALVRDGGIEPERVLKYALLDFDDAGRLLEVREKPAADDPLALRAERWVSMNLWSFTPVIFEACARVRPSARGELEIQDAVNIAIRELGEIFHVVPMRAGVLDLSSRADIALVASRLAGIAPRP